MNFPEQDIFIPGKRIYFVCHYTSVHWEKIRYIFIG